MFAQPVPSALTTGNTFLLNPRREGFLNGEARRFYDFRTSNALGMAIVFVLFSILGGGIGFIGGREVITRWQLAQSGVETSATVTNLQETTSTNSEGQNTTNYYLTYEFHAEGVDHLTQYSREQKIGSTTYNNLTEQSLIPIRYLANDPTVSRYLSDSEDDGRLVLLIATPFLAVVLMLLYIIVRQWRRNQRLVQEGQLIVGKIVEIRGSHVKGGYQVSITYNFRSPEGREMSRKESLLRNDLRTGLLPKAGTQLAVVYVNDRLFRIL
jgi:hypothetical protein